MKIGFGERPYDIPVLWTYQAVVTLLAIVLGHGFLLGVLVPFFIPGYFFVAVLFPDGESITWLERIVLSVATSISLVPLALLSLQVVASPIESGPVLATLILLSTSLATGAYRRRMSLQPSRRLRASLSFDWPVRLQSSKVDAVIAIALASSIVGTIGAIAYASFSSRPSSHFTEFYLLGPSGSAYGYPTSLNVSERGSVYIGIVNHESRSVNYSVRIDLVGLIVVYNATVEQDETVEANRTNLSWHNTTLGNAENWTLPFSFQINGTGFWIVQFRLYKDDTITSQRLDLRVTVK